MLPPSAQVSSSSPRSLGHRRSSNLQNLTLLSLAERTLHNYSQVLCGSPLAHQLAACVSFQTSRLISRISYPRGIVSKRKLVRMPCQDAKIIGSCDKKANNSEVTSLELSSQLSHHTVRAGQTTAPHLQSIPVPRPTAQAPAADRCRQQEGCPEYNVTTHSGLPEWFAGWNSETHG